MEILQFDGGVFIFPRKGEQLFGGEFDALVGKNDEPIYITDLMLHDTDITGKLPCLNDTRILYSFGKGFGGFAVSGEVLIGNTEVNSPSGDLKTITDFFEEHRVANSKKPLTIPISGKTRTNMTVSFYLEKYQVGPSVAETGVVQFNLSGTLRSIS